MYLSRYVISKKSIILEISPEDGNVLRRFKQPEDWEWDPYRETAHWEEYSGKTFLVYKFKGKLIFQEGVTRYELDSNFSAKLKRVSPRYIKFQLFERGKIVYEFKYQDPQTRLGSLLAALAFDDDWWDWDTPFEDVYKYLKNGS